jgi:RHS repeat-associated protein
VLEQPFRFQGQQFDEETGLHYNYFRDYDPATGRYLQQDPIGLEGGINTYSYANADPNKYIDPTGEAGIKNIIQQPWTGGGGWGGGGSRGVGGGSGGLTGGVSRAAVPRSAGSAKNSCGNLDNAAQAARTQPHGPNTTTKRRVPQNLSEELTMQEAKGGAGEVVIKNLSDPRYKGWEKLQHVHRNSNGTNTTIHYIRDPNTSVITDFKFK